MTSLFIDTNIFLRHLTGIPPGQAKRATAFLEQIERKESHVITSIIVIFEVVFTLSRAYNQTKQQIRDALLPLIELPNLHVEGKRQFRKVFNLYIDRNIPFADAYFVVFMDKKKIKEIISFDHDFDKISGIKRKES